MSILLTAFEGCNNSSKVILDRVNGENIIKLLLPNKFDVCGELIKEYIARYRPKYVISMGRKPLIKRLWLEPTAQRNGQYIQSQFDLLLLEESLRNHKISFSIANRPSNYLCNHVYYEGLEFIQHERMKTQMIFLHTPDMQNFENMDSVVCWLSEFCKER